MKIGRVVGNGCYMSAILFNLYVEHLMEEILTNLDISRLEGLLIIRFENDTAIIAKAQNELQDMMNK